MFACRDCKPYISQLSFAISELFRIYCLYHTSFFFFPFLPCLFAAPIRHKSSHHCGLLIAGGLLTDYVFIRRVWERTLSQAANYLQSSQGT